MSDLTNQRQDKLTQLKAITNAYPQPNLASRQSTQESLVMEGKTVTVAGRILLLRGHGKILFADLHDLSGKIQLFFEQNTLNEKMDQTKLFDLGDIISASGEVFKTTAGEITIRVSDFQILAKNLRPLPEKFHGLTDVEERYRQRYVDLIVNPESREIFKTRSKILSTMRHFLDEHGFMEVETPILQPIYGGASAKPFVTHHNELDQQMYLRISDELYLKRLIVGGLEKVYEVSKDFRNEGVSRFHNPEFTQIEFYWAYVDYDELMRLTEQLVSTVIKTVKNSLTVSFQGKELDFTPPFARKTFRDAIFEKINIDIDKIKTEEEFKKELQDKKLKLDLSGVVGLGAHFDALYKEFVRPFIIGPVFITDYPSEMIALAKRKADNPEKIASFQLLACGAELLKAYNELNDPKDQKDRWLDEVALEKKGAETAMQMDDDYIRALEYGMPPTAGWGMGIDRFTQFLTDSPTIKDVILFPAMREEKSLPAVGGSLRGGEADAAISSGKSSNVVYQIDSEFQNKYPDVKTGIAIIEGVSVVKENNELEKQKLDVESKYSGKTIEDLNNISTLNSYQKFFKEFGVDPTSRQPSPLALAKRIVDGKHLYKINTLVDAYNIACLETNIGMSAMNLDNLSLPMNLRFAKDGEKITLLGGDETKTTKSGEVVYSDQSGIITLDLNYRDCDKTKITDKTKNVLLTVDGCPGISDEEIEKALDREIELIQKYCGGNLVLKKVGNIVKNSSLRGGEADAAISSGVGLASDKIIIGEIIELENHPNADKLHVCKINTGTEVLQIVCGAPNISVGDIVPVSTIGAQVFDEEHNAMEIKVAKLRGIESHGMLCSIRELGLGDDHSGIYLLDKKLKENLGEAVNKFVK